jgi:hypothetical protein
VVLWLLVVIGEVVSGRSYLVLSFIPGVVVVSSMLLGVSFG